MPRIGTSNNGSSSSYQTSDGLWQMFISHQNAPNEHVRSSARFVQRKVVTDPLDSTKSKFEFQSWTIVHDRPLSGFTLTEETDFLTGVKTLYDATFAGKIIGRET